MAPKPQKYDLKTNIPVDLRLGKIYQNDGNYGPFIRVLAWIREPTEPDYVYRSFLGNMELLGQFYQLGFAQDEDKLNDDNLPFVETLKDGESDVVRLLLEEKQNERTGKRFTEARITHWWDGTTWQEAPELHAAPPNDPPPPPPAAAPPPQAGPPAAAAPAPPPATGGPTAAPAATSAPAGAPMPAPTHGKPTYSPVQIGYAYHIARCLVIAAGVPRDSAHEATTTVFIEIMRNEPPPPSAWYHGVFENTKTESGDDGLPF